MLTLVRPLDSPDADQIERRLNEMLAAYNVLFKEVSAMPYLIEAGNVFTGEAIHQFLDKLNQEIKRRQSKEDVVEFD